MTERERLIELLKLEQSNDSEVIADYLLANGVIAPPCKVGDDVWVLALDGCCIMGENKGWHYKVAYEKFKYRLLDRYKFSETLFLTKEEAEQALKERQTNENT